jgi:hypothetical protein
MKKKSKQNSLKNMGILAVPKTKRPSVETEGRLTIACHMKNLQKI